MLFEYPAIHRTERYAPRFAVRREQPIERVSGPREWQCLLDERHERDFGQYETWVTGDCVGELGLPDLETADLREELHL